MLQHRRNAHAGGLFQNAAQQAEAEVAVDQLLAGLAGADGRFGEDVIVAAALAQGGVHGGLIGQAAGVAEQVPDGHAVEDVRMRRVRQQAAHGGIQREQAVSDTGERHQRRGHLGDGGDAVERVIPGDVHGNGDGGVQRGAAVAVVQQERSAQHMVAHHQVLVIGEVVQCLAVGHVAHQLVRRGRTEEQRAVGKVLQRIGGHDQASGFLRS